MSESDNISNDSFNPIRARLYHEQTFKYSNRKDTTLKYPRVSLDDLTKTKRLGNGAFAEVYAVRGLITQKRECQVSSCSSCSTKMIDSDDESESSERPELFALKQLQSSITGGNLERAVADLVTEARLLAQIDHPHIVRLQAISSGPRLDKGFFLVIDYLNVSLKKRMQEWQVEEHHFAGLSGKLYDFNGHRRSALFQQRLRAGRDLGSAIQYLHAKRICVRDLKLENVGFDRDGSIKLFDFGLSRELPETYQNHKDELFKMTARTGTLKYMPPEVALGKPYNESCDVYSFAILLWEILSLKRAFSHYSNAEIEESVVRAPYKRPTRNQKWPEELKNMMHKAWSPRISDRPTAKDMALMLMNLCSEEHQNKGHSIDVHKSHHFQFHKPKFHIFDHKHSGQSIHHPHHKSTDTDDCSSSVHGEPLFISIR